MAQIIIATHGGLSRGMLDSLHMVAGGAADGIETYSLELGQNPNDYYEELRERIAASDEQFIIMCDIKGGSVHNVLFRLTELDADAAQRVLDAAREGVTVTVGGAIADEDEDEDF